MEKGYPDLVREGGGDINKSEPNTRNERKRVSVLRRGKKRGGEESRTNARVSEV